MFKNCCHQLFVEEDIVYSNDILYAGISRYTIRRAAPAMPWNVII